jgi:hypothetical protein
MKNQFAFFLITVLIASGCTSQKPNKKYFIGIWKSEQGGEFEFNSDGSFIAKGIVSEKLFGSSEGLSKTFSESGTWNFENVNGRFTIPLTFNNGIKSTGKYFMKLNIVGENGIAENKPPWRLYVWIGDPDDMNKYEFRKK